MSTSDYATFVATVLSLDDELDVRTVEGGATTTTLRRQYFPTPQAEVGAVRSPLPILANGVGIALLAFTTDDQVILTRRRGSSRARPGERDVSVVEGMDAIHDSPASGKLDAYCTAIRGCKEELGVPVTVEAVQFLALGVDMKYYQWSLLGMVDIPFSAVEVMTRYQLHAKDRWEGKIEPLIADPARVFERLQRDGTWDLGMVCTYLAFCKKLDVTEVQRAAERVLGESSVVPPWRRS